MSRNLDAAGRVRRGYAWAGHAQIHYRRAGPPGARSPLLLVHDRADTAAPFEAFMSEMGHERSVIAPDLPGHGMSDALDDGADTPVLAGALLEVVAELGLGMVDIVGIRDGGAVALEMARQCPEVVRRIVLVSGPAPSGLLSQPLLSLDMPGFPGADDALAASAVRDFLDR